MVINHTNMVDLNLHCERKARLTFAEKFISIAYSKGARNIFGQSFYGVVSVD